MILEDIIKPFDQLSDSEALDIILRIRSSRLIPKKQAPVKSEKAMKEKTPVDITKGLSKKGAQDLLALLLERRKKDAST